MRTNWFFPPPLTSTSTTSMPSERATRCAISSMRDDVACRIMNRTGVPAQQKSGLSPTRQVRHSKNYCTTDGEKCKFGGIDTTTPNGPRNVADDRRIGRTKPTSWRWATRRLAGGRGARGYFAGGGTFWPEWGHRKSVQEPSRAAQPIMWRNLQLPPCALRKCSRRQSMDCRREHLRSAQGGN